MWRIPFKVGRTLAYCRWRSAAFRDGWRTICIGTQKSSSSSRLTRTITWTDFAWRTMARAHDTVNIDQEVSCFVLYLTSNLENESQKFFASYLFKSYFDWISTLIIFNGQKIRGVGLAWINTVSRYPVDYFQPDNMRFDNSIASQ